MANVLYEQQAVSTPELTKYQSSLLNVLWFGFVLYTVSFTFGTTESINIALAELFQLLGLMLFIPAALALLRFRLESNYLKVVYTIYCLWLAVVVARGFTMDYSAIKKMLFDPYNGIFLYLVPIILLLPNRLAHFRKIFVVIIVLNIFYLLYDIMFVKKLIQAGDENSRTVLEYFAKTLGISAGFILITYVYQPKKFILIAAVAVFATLLLAVIGARRGLMFMTGIILLFTFIIYTYQNRRRILNVLLSVIAAILTLAYAFSMFYESDSTILRFSKERLDEDTRSVVELYFYDDMQTQDWLIGRGMNGLVAAPVSLNDDHVGGMPGYRDGIETDYLKIILKGGIISLGLLLLIAVPAIFLGLFFSNNTLSKAAALWVIFWALSLYPTNITNFTMNYILVWVGIGICYSKTIRSMSEEEVQAHFQI